MKKNLKKKFAAVFVFLVAIVSLIYTGSVNAEEPSPPTTYTEACLDIGYQDGTGQTEYGFLPCVLPVVDDGTPPTTVVDRTLPSTGGRSWIILIVSIALVGVGYVMVKLANRLSRAAENLRELQIKSLMQDGLSRDEAKFIVDRDVS